LFSLETLCALSFFTSRLFLARALGLEDWLLQVPLKTWSTALRPLRLGSDSKALEECCTHCTDGYMNSSPNSDPRQIYHTQIMSQQAQALDALQKVAKLEECIDSSQANGKYNAQVEPVSQNEVCRHVFAQ
jgi:hypothetical protein